MAHVALTKEETIDLEKSYWDAMKEKDGSKTSKLSAKTSLVTGAKGVMSIPKSKMGAMTEEGKCTLESYTFRDVEGSTPTPDVAIIARSIPRARAPGLGARDTPTPPRRAVRRC